mmetsp:Transcript_19647/g.36349  ORF Transcript_19647/g.36349 Transcript_19647/m.36349 type:complete len:247 (+) Transcript_19647:1451-2191(+)
MFLQQLRLDIHFRSCPPRCIRNSVAVIELQSVSLLWHLRLLHDVDLLEGLPVLKRSVLLLVLLPILMLSPVVQYNVVDITAGGWLPSNTLLSDRIYRSAAKPGHVISHRSCSRSRARRVLKSSAWLGETATLQLLLCAVFSHDKTLAPIVASNNANSANRSSVPDNADYFLHAMSLRIRGPRWWRVNRLVTSLVGSFAPVLPIGSACCRAFVTSSALVAGIHCHLSRLLLSLRKTAKLYQAILLLL